MSTYDSSKSAAWPTIRELVAIPFRQRGVVLLTFVICLLVAVGLSFSPPKYEAHMKILVQRQRVQPVLTSSSTEAGAPAADAVTEEDLNSEAELLTSDDMLRNVVVATGLQGAPAGVGNESKQLERAVRRLGKQLSVVPLRKSDVISVEYADKDPQTAAKVLQTLAANYISKHLELNHSSGELQFFQQQMDRYRDGLHEAQQKLIEFTNETGVVSAVTEKEDALTKATEFESAARQADVEASTAQARANHLQDMLDSLPPRVPTMERASDNPQLLMLKQKLLELELKREDLLTKFLPTYRLVQEVNQEIVLAHAAVDKETNSPLQERTTDENPDYILVRSELIHSRSDLAGMNARAAAARADSAHYRQQAIALQKNWMSQDDLLQQVKVQQENYLLYARKLEEGRIDEALDQRGIVNVALAEQPVVPALPARPPLYLSIFVVIFGIPLSVAAGFAFDLLDTSLRTPDRVEDYLGIPVLAAYPEGALA